MSAPQKDGKVLNALELIMEQQKHMWACPKCGLMVKEERVKCNSCETDKPGTTPDPSASTGTSAGGGSAPITFGVDVSTPVTFGVPVSSTMNAAPTFGTNEFTFQTEVGFGGGGGASFDFGETSAATGNDFGFGSPSKPPFTFGVADTPFTFGVPDSKESATEDAQTTPPIQPRSDAPFTPSTTKKFTSLSVNTGSSTMDVDATEDVSMGMDVDGKEFEETRDSNPDESEEDFCTSDDPEISDDDSFRSEADRKFAFKNKKNSLRQALLKKQLLADMERIEPGTNVVCSTGDGSINGVLGLGCDPNSIDSNFPVPVSSLYGKRILMIASGAMSCAALTEENELYVWGSNEHGELGEDPLDIPDLGDESDLPVDQKREQMAVEYERRLRELYTQHKPTNLEKVPHFLEKYGDNIHELYAKACRKYGVTPEDEFVPCMDREEARELKKRLLNPSQYLKSVTDEREFARRASCIYWTPARIRIPNRIDVCQIAFGSSHVVILDSDGLVYSMGTFNSDGLVGHHYIQGERRKVLFERNFCCVNKLAVRPMPHPIREVACAANHFLMLDTGDDIWQMGVTQLGQRTSSRNNRMYLRPHPVERVMFRGKRVKFERIRCGEYHNLAISTNFDLFTWGQNNFLQCGHDLKATGFNGVVDHPRPVIFPEEVKVSDVRAGQHFTVVLDDRGRVWTFGRNACNQLGRKTQRPPRIVLGGRLVRQECLTDMPGLVTGLEEIDLISAGASFFFVRSKLDHKKVVAFGFAALGSCGVGNWHAASGRHVFDGDILPDGFSVVGMCGSSNHSIFLLERQGGNNDGPEPAAKRRRLERSVEPNEMDEDGGDVSSSAGSAAPSRKRSRGSMERDANSPPDMESPPKKSQRTAGKRSASSKKSRRKRRSCRSGN